MVSTTDLHAEMELQLEEALREWTAAHPDASPEEYVVVYSDATVLGPYSSGEEATKAAFSERPKGLPHICQIGANQYAVDRLKSSGTAGPSR